MILLEIRNSKMLNYCGIDPDSLLSLNGIIDRTGSEIRHVNYKYPQVPEGQKESCFFQQIYGFGNVIVRIV